MTHSLERICPTRLDEGVGKTTWPRELQPVATAFDGMLARLENSFTKLSQFSADLAHELRTPISNIRGEAEVTLTRPRTLRSIVMSLSRSPPNTKDFQVSSTTCYFSRAQK